MVKGTDCGEPGPTCSHLRGQAPEQAGRRGRSSETCTHTHTHVRDFASQKVPEGQNIRIIFFKKAVYCTQIVVLED